MKGFFSAAAERFWLFTIAAIALAIIGFMAIAIVWRGSMPEGAGEFFGAAITGLLLVAQKVIDAQQARRMSDQLAASRPDDGEVRISNGPGDPVPVKEEPKHGTVQEGWEAGEEGGEARPREP